MRALLRVAGLVFLTACADTIPMFERPREAPAPLYVAAYAFPASGARPLQVAAPPIGLTASDGSGIKLVSLEARAIVEDPLAFTELRLVFDNPEDRQREGTFSITLPEGAALSRFAMRIDDAWQEGEVVEKKAAREAYEDFLHRRQDPALLEQAAGNQFAARVFPIPARGRKEIVVSYSQEIGGGKAWTLPLRGLPELERLDVTVTLAGERDPIARTARSHVTPEGDLQLDPRLVPHAPGLRSGEIVLARVQALPDAGPDPLGATLILVDTSASRALGLEEEIGIADGIVRAVAASAGARTRVAVAAFDQTTDAIFEGEAGAWGEADARRLRARQAFGASDLGRAIGWAEERAAARGYRRVVLIGDGVATAGETSAAEIAARAARLGRAGVERVDAIAVGGIRDEATLKKITTAGLPRDGVVADVASGAEAVVQRLGRVTRSGIAVEVEGARWSWPARLDGVQPGDEAIVYAEVPEGQPVRVRVDGRTGPALVPAAAPRPLLERAFAKAKIASLVERAGSPPEPALVREVVGISTRHRVLSPYTSLLVLETDRDFARFGLDRKAMADILTVDGGRLAVVNRTAPSGSAEAPADTRTAKGDAGNSAPRLTAPRPEEASVAQAEAPAAASPGAAPPPAAAAAPGDPLAARGNMWGSEIGDSFGAGGLALSGIGDGGGGLGHTGGGGRGESIGLGSVGTVGHGAGVGSGQGFGSGHGRLGGAARVAAPTLSAAAPTVNGGLGTNSALTVVRRNLPRVRRCYEQGLARSPGLAGQVAVRFLIGRDGRVASARVDRRSGLDEATAACIVGVFSGLRFPEPDGGSPVEVVFPFTFTPGDTTTTRRQVVLPTIDVPVEDAPKPARVEPYTGRFKSVMDAIGAGGAKTAVETAYAWHHEAPGDVMALVALGEALEAAGETATAARAYGSIVDLFPARADLRRFAGERLERLAGGAALDLAADTFAKAEEQRPDHPASHRLLAFARLRRGDYPGAFAAAVRGAEQHYPPGRFRGVDRILREDLGLIAAAWIKAEPGRREEILGKLRDAGGTPEDGPSLRFVLTWETDANDVDFHIEDASGAHAYFRQPELPGGGQLYADVTTGYGPECFTIRLPRAQRSAWYALKAHYYARGPMGYGMGKLEIVDHDGKGGLTFEERPFVVMADHAYVDLGTVAR